MDTHRKYMTLSEARSIECNGCGDCCDSRRTDGYWTWGSLPTDQYASINNGEPLIIPIIRSGKNNDQWIDRDLVEQDQLEYSPTRFRCSAFLPQEDGRGFCGNHDALRPDKCGEYPVNTPGIEKELLEQGEVVLNTDAFSRCAWFGVTVVLEHDNRLMMNSNNQ